MNAIQEFGFVNPVLLDDDDILIAGHGRTEAAKTLNLTEIPAIRLSGLSDSQKKALRIADNKLLKMRHGIPKRWHLSAIISR